MATGRGQAVKDPQQPGLTYFKAHLGDPFGTLIIDRLSLSPLRLALIFLVAALVVDLISFVLVGDDVIRLSGWKDTWAYVVYLYVIFPAIIGAYVWICSAVAELVSGLRESQAVVASDEALDHFVKDRPGSLQALYNHPVWSIASLIVVAPLAVYYALVYTRGWPAVAILLRGLKVLVLYVPGWYAICQIVARHGVTIWGLRQVFRRFEVAPHPLHPDRCGGLRAINNYAVGFTYIIAVAGIGVGLMSYVTVHRSGALAPDTAIWLGIYGIVALFGFFLPPWTAHAAMAEAKRKLLMDISQQFQEAYAKTTASLQGGTGELKEHVERIESLHSLYQLTDSFTVWPFDTATLRRFAVTVTVPLVPLLTELVVDIGGTLLRSR
jgi:hypothetical protein